MKKALRLFTIGIIGIILLDIVGSITSRQFNFNYGLLFFIETPFIIAIAYLIAKQTDKKTTLLYLALVGLFDATIGWKTSMLLHANTGTNEKMHSVVAVIITICIVTIMYSLWGLLGWWLAKKTIKH